LQTIAAPPRPTGMGANAGKKKVLVIIAAALAFAAL
jgi:hypothetical protein